MTTRRPGLLDAINFEHAYEFSYAAHHVDNIEYLNLFRSDVLTLKAYFFPYGSHDDVVVPHDHRYNFTTTCVRGRLQELKYRVVGFRGVGVEPYDLCAYECLVDGGSGFKRVQEQALRVETADYKYQGAVWENKAHVDIHTLSDVTPGTILLLTQYRDVGRSTTRAWSTRGTLPVAAGYEKMERAAIKARIEELQAALEVL